MLEQQLGSVAIHKVLGQSVQNTRNMSFRKKVVVLRQINKQIAVYRRTPITIVLNLSSAIAFFTQRYNITRITKIVFHPGSEQYLLIQISDFFSF